MDGSGDLIWQEPGTRFTVRELLIRMIRNSDSVATDMLMRLLGEEEFNRQIHRNIVREGINRITTIIQVRYDAYGEIHENIRNLSNMDIVRVNSSDTRTGRYNMLLELIGIERSEARVNSVEEAFEAYYKKELNSGKVEAMGLMLERLVEGELLNEEHTAFLLDVMKQVTTGDRRIKAGLPGGIEFAQKTGTQIRRACNMGIIFPDGDQEDPIVIVACAKGYDSLADAEKVLENLGRLVSRSLLD